MKWLSILSMLVLAGFAFADDGDDLLTDFDEYVDDARDLKFTAVQKMRFVNQAKVEFAKALVYWKLDTIITSANTEQYALNTDNVGVLRSAYIKRQWERTFIQVIDHEDLRNLAQPDAQQILYAFVNDDGNLGLHAVPAAAETLIVSYYAEPTDIADASTEWDMPDHYEDACLRVGASKALMKIQTEWALKARQQLYEMGWADVERLKNPATETRQEGDTP